MPDTRPAALIVEDQPFVGMVASDILRESGYDTFHACDAKDAAALLDQHPEIELVVTDAELSGPAHGLELARQVSRERPNVQLVVTAADHEFAQSELPPGARVLRKPYASGELRTLVAAKSLLEEA
jgi:CheY-like chemotaxis protein